ncbi:MAG: FAD-binding oxidoreductase, partial [Planctomycetia bacterium]|nr:FAD-binding oxidoreductase [Planctomycetia bacterium]
MTAAAPAVPRSILSDKFLAELRAIVGDDGLLSDRDELLVYECDGFTIAKNVPDVVVFPASTEQVAAVVKLCNRHQVPFVPRGAGTSLAGGCLPVGGGVMIALTRMK